MFKEIQQSFAIDFSFPVVFTRQAFHRENRVFADTLQRAGKPRHRVLVVIDSGVAEANPALLAQAHDYARAHGDLLALVGPGLIMPGGERCKNGTAEVDRVHALVNSHGLCRHSFVLAIGGGAVLDVAGFATATAHRGLRLIRMPTTVLAQNDAGIGVKNGINAFGRKNFLGTFAPPFAVINDLDLLATLAPRDLRAGLAEAVKVAAIKDVEFLSWMHRTRRQLSSFDPAALEYLIVRCAELHLDHIRSGDPFELGSARPLDFGHWSAHRLEEITQGELRHGEAVAIGMALDSLYAQDAGLLSELEVQRLLEILQDLGFCLYHEALWTMNVEAALDQFREHLGGELCVTLPQGLGRRLEVHQIELGRMKRCIALLAERYGS